jgi:PAS domain S-box-containing protein
MYIAGGTVEIPIFFVTGVEPVKSSLHRYTSGRQLVEVPAMYRYLPRTLDIGHNIICPKDVLYNELQSGLFFYRPDFNITISPSDALRTIMVSPRDENFDCVPLCVVALDERGRAVQVNETCLAHFGPFFKYSAATFSTLATDSPEHRAKLEDALKQARLSAAGASNGAQNGAPNGTPSGAKSEQKPRTSFKARNIEMLTLSEGLPIKKHFDWTIGVGRDGQVLLFGDAVNEQDEEQRAKDAELIDFFQNAPIALHWLSGEGIVLWANQTELDVLGYTAEEYIGQPIMNFCPDEQELVLEIFKTLGSGNTIRDVPVRFRTKDGRLVNLLIDSNVKYDDAGKFSHTRCFIRDDTGRKIREARAALLLKETKRSLEMLDQFMSRSLHHLRTPLHVLQSTCDLVLGNLKHIQQQETASAEGLTGTAGALQESVTLINDATEHITSAVVLIDDISDLARLDRGVDFEINKEWIALSNLGESAVASVEAKKGVKINFHLADSGPAYLHSDVKLLQKVLRHLLDNAVQVTERGSITLMLGQEKKCCSFAVVINEMGSVAPHEPGAGAGLEYIVDTKLPAIFQRYHQVLLPEETLDIEEATSLRDAIERGVSSLCETLIGIGLSLSYHLVLALGGDIRYSSQSGLTKFWFSLPQDIDTALLAKPTSVISTSHERIAKPYMQIFQNGPVAPVPVPASKKQAASSDQDDAAGRRNIKFFGEPRVTPVPVPMKDIACNGLKAMDPPSILVVEDTAMCAKLLCRTLRKVGCSATWVENGQQAVDLLRESTPGIYSLILMDLRMPVMDGLIATAIIKKELKLKIPVIALTGDTSSDVKSQCENIGFSEFCGKPMTRAQLLDIIQKYTGYRCVTVTPVPVQVKTIASSDLKAVDTPSVLIVEAPVPIPAETIASSGLKAMDTQSVLVVEDTAMEVDPPSVLVVETPVPLPAETIACNGLKAMDPQSVLEVEDSAMAVDPPSVFIDVLHIY